MLISAIMPTGDRLDLAPLAVTCFLRQTVTDSELIVIDDGAESLAPHLPPDPRIRHYRNARSVSIGQKCNQACQVAHGKYIVRWDDDDWSAPERLADQLERLEKSGKAVTGYNTLLYWDMRTAKAYRFQADRRDFTAGTSLCFRRTWWEKYQFMNVRIGEDNRFAGVARAARQIVAVDGGQMIVARQHHKSTSRPGLGNHFFPEISPAQLPEDFFRDMGVNEPC